MVVTPHLGAATAEAQDRAGTITADQVRRALSGGVVTNAVNIAAVRPEEMEALAPFVPLCEKLGRLAQGLGNGSRGPDRGRVPGPDRRARHPPARASRCWWGSSPGTPRSRSTSSTPRPWPRSAGIDLIELKDAASEEFTELVTVRIESGDESVEVAGTAVGPRNLPIW